MTKKPLISERVMRVALGDQDVRLFAYQPALHYIHPRRFTGHRMLFTREVTWPGTSEEFPVHMGIYLCGSDHHLSCNLFTEWMFMIGDLKRSEFIATDNLESFDYGIARYKDDPTMYLNFDMQWGSDDQESAF